MPANVGTTIAALDNLTVTELRQRYAEVFGEPTHAGHKTWLIKRIAWRLQALAEGDLSQLARCRAAELAKDADLRRCPPKPRVNGGIPKKPHDRLPPPGNLLARP